MGVGVTCGYGYAARELITAWNNKGIPVWWGREDCEIAISFCQPESYAWQHDDQIKIGYTPWESTELPPGWVDKMNQMDEIWAPCQANIDWYKNAGVKVPMRVLPHGINRDHFPLKKRTIAEGEMFRFLHIGEPTIRKGGEETYNAFRQAFSEDENVCLIMLGKPHFPYEGTNVHAIEEVLNQDELRELYLSCHAMVYPTYGEGFGFIPFQGAATGMPTLVTEWSAPLDYMQYCFPIKVEKLVPCSYWPHEGLWAKPDVGFLSRRMKDLVESPNYYFSSAYRKVHNMDAEWSWDAIAELSLNWMRDLLRNK